MKVLAFQRHISGMTKNSICRRVKFEIYVLIYQYYIVCCNQI